MSGFVLESDSLLHKFGFNDGDPPDEVLAWCAEKSLPPPDDWPELLGRLVRSYLVPALVEQDVEIAEVETSHNPVRALSIGGVDVDHRRFGEPDQPTLTEVQVEVPWAVVHQLVLDDEQRLQAAAAALVTQGPWLVPTDLRRSIADIVVDLVRIRGGAHRVLRASQRAADPDRELAPVRHDARVLARDIGKLRRYTRSDTAPLALAQKYARAIGRRPRLIRGPEPIYAPDDEGGQTPARARIAALAKSLARILDDISVNASSADLSSLTDAEPLGPAGRRDWSLLGKVVWTRRTIWPDDMDPEAYYRSREVTRGVFQVGDAQGGAPLA